MSKSVPEKLFQSQSQQQKHGKLPNMQRVITKTVGKKKEAAIIY